jgi:TetR/AcrR family transcriptional regulator, cholesterol catabolism regulator
MMDRATDAFGDAIDERLKIIYPRGEKKWEITKAAAKLFIKKGTINTGVREIAEASGITVGTLYHHFKSKDDIIAAFMDFAGYGTDIFARNAAEVFDNMNPVEALSAAMKQYFVFTDEAQNVVLFWHQETRNLKPELRKRLLDNELVLIGVFEKIIKRGIATGVFRPVDARIVAHDIIIMGDMWSFRRWDLAKRYTSTQFIDKQIDLILHSLKGGSKSTGKRSKEVKAGR